MIWIKSIFAIPGILLPISLLAVGLFIGNSALDVKISSVHYPTAVDILQEKYRVLLVLSWAFHILISYKKLLPVIPAWLHVLITLTCLLFFYCTISQSVPGASRYYYDDGAWSVTKFLGLWNSNLVITAEVFVAVQIIFWIYSIWLLAAHWKNSKRNIDG